MTDDEVAAVCDVARAHERVVAAHARSAESIKMCVRHGVDVIYHATYADDEALDMLEAHKEPVFVAPALSVTLTRLREAGKFGLPSTDAMRAAHRARPRAHDRVDEGADRRAACACCPAATTASCGIRTAPTRATCSYFVELLGFTPMEAIVGATEWGGEIMGMGDELGQVREGYLADLLLVDGDPLPTCGSCRIARGCSRS